ncbi:hypothetical protein ID854_00140 [Xenorhabdus sp. M]|uniref:Uncharacterized protein n=1 Tax=Xenorhabdus szentirmaii TaxID=290112 RepID=A0AAW3YMX5_9GAMM|nr:hypothetical protein [Xenorhabdus sp. M]MBD2798912.1 hypothetical protein [Xenorhabdus sp. M]
MPKNLPLASEKPWQHKPVLSIWMALSRDQTVPALIIPLMNRHFGNKSKHSMIKVYN